MGILKNFFVSIFVVFFLTNNSWSKSATEFINSLSSEASNILSSKLSEDEKIIRLKEIGEQSVDIEGVGLYTLGKYKKLSDSQKNNIKNFKKLFFEKFFEPSSRIYRC